MKHSICFMLMARRARLVLLRAARSIWLNYLRIDFVLSTADQEFQGLAIQEAMLSGCIPVVPDALSYPEYIPVECRYGTVNEAVDVFLSQRTAKPIPIPIPLGRYTWSTIGPDWTAALGEICLQ